MLKVNNAVAVTAAVLGACCFNCDTCYVKALQSFSAFNQSPRGYDIVHGYMDESHPFSYDPPNVDLGTASDFSEGLQLGRPNGMQRTVQASVETNISRGYRYRWDRAQDMDMQDMDLAERIEVPETQEVPEILERRRRNTLRRKGRLGPRSLSPSMLPTRRKKRIAHDAVPTSDRFDLLTFDEEKAIAEDIQLFKSVTRARDNLLEWMSRETNGMGTHQQEDLFEHQWALSCSLSVERLREVMARGQEARTRLIKGNVGLVTMVAKRYDQILRGGVSPTSGGGAGGTDATLKLDDLIQEGYMGIMEAAERFNPEKGYRFSTYATHWIRQRILRSIAESARMIRLPVHVQTMIRNMHKKKKEMESRHGRPPSMPELAHEMGIPLDKVQLYQHLTKNVLSLELPVDSHSNTDDKRTLGDLAACTEFGTPDEDFMSESLTDEVHAMLDILRNDERMVINHRFGLLDGRPKSVRETSEGLGVSVDKIRMVEAKALNKLRQPRMNYRLKDYMDGSGMSHGGELDYAEHGGLHHNNMMNGGVEEHPMHGGMHHSNMMNNGVEEHPMHGNIFYPHPVGEDLREYGHMGDDDSENYERPSPESIWSF